LKPDEKEDDLSGVGSFNRQKDSQTLRKFIPENSVRESHRDLESPDLLLGHESRLLESPSASMLYSPNTS